MNCQRLVLNHTKGCQSDWISFSLQRRSSAITARFLSSLNRYPLRLWPISKDNWADQRTLQLTSLPDVLWTINGATLRHWPPAPTLVAYCNVPHSGRALDYSGSLVRCTLWIEWRKQRFRVKQCYRSTNHEIILLGLFCDPQAQIHGTKHRS